MTQVSVSLSSFRKRGIEVLSRGAPTIKLFSRNGRVLLSGFGILLRRPDRSLLLHGRKRTNRAPKPSYELGLDESRLISWK
mgnify:CR=1 FL=1